MVTDIYDCNGASDDLLQHVWYNDTSMLQLATPKSLSLESSVVH